MRKDSPDGERGFGFTSCGEVDDSGVPLIMCTAKSLLVGRPKISPSSPRSVIRTPSGFLVPIAEGLGGKTGETDTGASFRGWPSLPGLLCGGEGPNFASATMSPGGFEAEPPQKVPAKRTLPERKT